MDNGEKNYRRYLDGDDDGIVQLIKEYKDPLLLYLNGITGNFSFAEELIEDVFFKLAVKKPLFRGKSSFKTWLFAIARNVAIDSIRRSSKIVSLPIENYAYLADETDIEQNYIKEEQRIYLHKSLSRLNSDYRQVLLLTYFEGFSIDEAALIMKKNKKQINNLLYRAKKSLKTDLEKGGFTYEGL